MKLTTKDKEFLEQLHRLVEERELVVELRERPFRHFVLRRNYGEKIHEAFHMTRQGIRWRFHRVFNQLYASALETILTIEKSFGASLRTQAMEIAQERYLLRRRNQTHLHGDSHDRTLQG